MKIGLILWNSLFKQTLIFAEIFTIVVYGHSLFYLSGNIRFAMLMTISTSENHCPVNIHWINQNTIIWLPFPRRSSQLKINIVSYTIWCSNIPFFYLFIIFLKVFFFFFNTIAQNDYFYYWYNYNYVTVSPSFIKFVTQYKIIVI